MEASEHMVRSLEQGMKLVAVVGETSLERMLELQLELQLVQEL